jgi:TATA-binding protein-associated factor
MSATYPRLSLTDKIPRFKTREDWESRKSTKVDICARMCFHLLSRDDAPRMIFEDGAVIFPEVPKPMPGERVSQELKIVIYQEFSSFGPLVRDVCTLLTAFFTRHSTQTGFHLF